MFSVAALLLYVVASMRERERKRENGDLESAN